MWYLRWIVSITDYLDSSVLENIDMWKLKKLSKVWFRSAIVCENSSSILFVANQSSNYRCDIDFLILFTFELY